MFRMSELNDSPDLQTYSSAILYVISAMTTPLSYVEVILDNFASAIKSSKVKPVRLFVSKPSNSLNLVMAHSPSCFTGPRCILLPQSRSHSAQRNLKANGCIG